MLRLPLFFRLLAALLTVLLPPANADERPFVHPLFTDHVVLQRGLPVPIWGWTTPGEKVTVSIGANTATAVADGNGKWLAKIGPFEPGEPRTINITGPQSVTVQDVLIGDVWICSGQSNMEMGLRSVNNAEQELANANYPQIRLFTVPKLIANEPRETVVAKWGVCTPASAGQGGGFSAVAYFFGRDLHQEIKIPIGLIHSSWGGTIAEAWTSAEALSALPDFEGAVAAVRIAAANKAGPLDLPRALKEWWQNNDPGSAAGAAWSDPATDVTTWKAIPVPGLWEQSALPGFDGIVWFHKEFDLPKEWEGKDLLLHLGAIDDRDTTWVNGTKVGETSEWTAGRNYPVPATVLRPGKNVIRLRVLDTGGGGGFSGTPEQVRLEAPDDTTIMPLSLAGEWLGRETAPMAKLTPLPNSSLNNPNVVTVLYNGMIAPLVPFAVKGAIWYQGEANAGRGRQYRTLLPALIQDWRGRFGSGEFPFLIVQLANYMQPKPEPAEDAWAELREAQLLTARTLPNTGLAVAIDLGDAVDIHPKNKQEVGRRLSLAGRALAHREKIVHSGPVYQSLVVDGTVVRLSFDHIGGGLRAKDDAPLKGFAIAGDDRKFVWAEARIDGSTVIVSSPKVTAPVAVRYAWESNPPATLYNAEGLPAPPFRTDDWPSAARK